jgi:pyruvate kinase
MGWVQPITESVVEAASQLSRRLGARLMVVSTHSGRTALALSKQRSATRVVARTSDPESARAMALYWGVTPLLSPADSNAQQALARALDWARARNLIAKGDRVILVSGTMPNDPTHNAVLVQEVE